MSPDRRAIAQLVARARLRTRALRVLRSLAVAGTVIALGYALFGHAVSTAAAAGAAASLLALAAVAATAWPGIADHDLACAIERATPESRNLILTAVELGGTEFTSRGIDDRVFADARRVSARIDLARAFPATRTLGLVTLALALSAATVAIGPGLMAARETPVHPDAAALEEVSIEIIPPEYSGLPAVLLPDPQRVEALAGSLIRVRARATASGARLETISGSSAMHRDQGEYRADIVADADGFLAVVPVNARGTPGPRRLVGLSVTPDRAPQARVMAPGRDLRMAEDRPTLRLAVSAEDDLGLDTLRVRYTRVSGSGENFSFAEGDVPLAVTKGTNTAWTGSADWSLSSLGLEPGDLLIYRAVARDRRPGSVPAESDAFIVEIVAPGAAATDGFAIDDREDRYAISQQMVIVKTERLLARRAGMRAPDYAADALDLAAEQRQVRAEFVFMMGGELADAGLDLHSLGEEHEAMGEDDLAAGRLANQGRADIMRAIRSMSRAAARLADGDLPAALPLEKEALAFLQRAFSKSRYILRTLGARERLDLSRRMTGLLADLGRDARPASLAPPNPRVDTLRRLLLDVAGVSLDRAVAADSASRLNVLAQRALEIDAASAPVRDAAAKLTGLAAALAAGRATDRMKDDAIAAVAALVRQALPPGAAAGMPADLASLAGALADERRRGGRR